MADENRKIGLRSCFIFGWLTFWLVASFLRTTFESSRSIPDDYEWDMGSENHSDIETSQVQRPAHYLK